ncbi:MAG: manganese efflux pump [Clostridiales bacterium]|nr:manganese efflux pump [Clostridiales bacterium]
MNAMFFINSIFLGVGLAMDAFSVSLANGLNEPNMKRTKTVAIAGVFSFFQFLMPLLGWICINTIMQIFTVLESFIPWIALILLGFIGGKMLYEGIKNKDEDSAPAVGVVGLLVQGVATSIDALSVGLTIADYDIIKALVSCLIIGAVTFIICFLGVVIGKKFGTKISNKANILGGIILIIIALEIFITGLIGV